MNEITFIWIDPSEADFFPKPLVSRFSKNENIMSLDSMEELIITAEVSDNTKCKTINNKIFQSPYSYIEEFNNPDYLNATATNASTWVKGRIMMAFGGLYTVTVPNTPVVTTGTEWLSPSIVQSISFYTGKGFVQKVIIYANETVFPNTSIHYQISTDDNIWIPINLNETHSYVNNYYHGLYWRAVLESEDHLHRGSSPQIDSLRIEFEVFYDEEPPSISLVNIQNNTAISPRTVIEVFFSDYLLDQSWFNWNDDNNQTITDLLTITCPITEDYHWLSVYVNDSLGHLTTSRYRFYVNHPPVIKLHSPSNNSVLMPAIAIEFVITDPTVIDVWYKWDNQGNTSLIAPYVVKTVNTTGTHVLLVGARDRWDMITLETFYFYILGSASIITTQHPPSTAFSGESFIYSFNITNSEVVPLNLTLIAFSTDDDVLTGNGSQIILNPGATRTMELQIRPKHASIHQLEIDLFYEDLLFYHYILKFNVAPQWMSPTFLLPLLISVIFMVVISCASFYYVRNQLVIRRLFWKQQAQLTHLIDQLTISNLEVSIGKEIEASGSEDPSSRPLGFHQYLQLSEPLDREALKQQLYFLRDQIFSGDSRNFQRLSGLLTKAEKSLNEFKEEIQ
ncbi:MAG: hypothetical protein ACXADY_07065 [Candidatus Hodarchaeales archaeon]